MTETRFSYRFGPVEHRGFLGAMSLTQALVLGGGAAGAALVLDAAPSAGGLLAALALVAGSLIAARATVSGHPIPVWLALIVRSLMPSSRATWFPGPSRLPGASRRGRRRRPCPPGLEGVSLGIVPAGERPAGVISEARGRRLTLSLACEVNGFALLDPETQERRVAAWGTLLASLGSSPVRRLTWTERTLPARADELARWLHDERDPAVPLRGNAMIDSYLELISGGAQVAQEHQILISLQIDARRMRNRHPGGVEAALREEASRIAQSLEAAEVRVLGALSPLQITRAMRTSFDPFSVAELAALALGGDGAEPETLEGAWPLAFRESWDHVRADGALHATYWISGWPRTDVTPMFLDPLLARTGPVRAVSVCFEPLSAERATREVEAALTRDQADRAVRVRFGQMETARQREVQQSALRREAELALGHGEVRYAGYVTVSGRDAEELRRSCGQVLDGAARARIELRRMYGQQASAFTHCLPLCRGLR